MAHQEKLKRYLLILERLPFRPSFADLAGHLEDHGLTLSHRTLQRDIEEIRAELGIRVVYDRSGNSYVLADADRGAITVVHMLERAQWLEAVRGREGHALAGHLQVQGDGRLLGVLHAAPLLKSIIERRDVRIRYRTGDGDASRELRVSPHLLKEHAGRWYLMGRQVSNKAPVVHALDRLLQVALLGRGGKKAPASMIAEHRAVVGVAPGKGKVKRVVLRLDRERAAQVASWPLHPSQSVVETDRRGSTIALDVMINTHLVEQLLAWGASVQVLEPKALAKEVRQAHKAAAAVYKR